jgi:hypothetical protein
MVWDVKWSRGCLDQAEHSEPSPDDKAASIINSVPSTSLWTKTGGVVLGTAVAAAAVSTELYVSIDHDSNIRERLNVSRS